MVRQQLIALIPVIPLLRKILEQQEGFCSGHSNCGRVNIWLTKFGSCFATFSLK
jgi:hypothetical protein